MPLQFPREVEQRLLASIKRFFAEHLEEDIGDLRASLVLDFCLREIGPRIYNQAIADAQATMQNHLTDLDSVCYLPESGYWKD